MINKILVKSLHRTDVEPLNYFPNGSFDIQWSSDAWQLELTTTDDGSLAYQTLDVENSIIWDGEEYVIKQCIPDYANGIASKQIVATHVSYEINRIRQRNVKTGTLTYASPEDVLEFFFNGLNDNLGFTYEVIGSFAKQQITDLGNISGQDMLSQITSTWDNAVIYPTNKDIRVYSQAEFAKNYGNRIDYIANSSEIKLTYDSTNVVNQVMAYGKTKDTDNDTTAYYFTPFIVNDQDSIDAYGLHEGADISDERFTDAGSMKTYATTQLTPEPALTVEVTETTHEKPIPGDLRRLEIRQDNYVTNVELVGYTYYPLDPDQVTQVTLNNTAKTILDYQSKNAANLTKELQEQRNKFLALDVQLTNLTNQVANAAWKSGSIFINMDADTSDYSIAGLSKLYNDAVEGAAITLTNGTKVNSHADAERTNALRVGMSFVGAIHMFQGAGTDEGNAFLNELNNEAIDTYKLVTLDVQGDVLSQTDLNDQIADFFTVIKNAGYWNTAIKASANSWADITYNPRHKWIVSWDVTAKPTGADAWGYIQSFENSGINGNRSYNKEVL